MWNQLAKITQRVLQNKEEDLSLLDRTNDLIEAACNKNSVAIRNILGDPKYDDKSSHDTFNRKIEDIELAIEGLKAAHNVEAAEFLREKVKAHTDIEI